MAATATATTTVTATATDQWGLVSDAEDVSQQPATNVPTSTPATASLPPASQQPSIESDHVVASTSADANGDRTACFKGDVDLVSIVEAHELKLVTNTHG